MTETTDAAIGNERRPVEIVEELPEIAIKDKLILNKADRYFYIGKDDKEDN